MPLDKVKLIDASFLHMETEEMSGHVASAPLFKLPPGVDADTFFHQLKEHLASRMHLLKTYKVRRVNTPFNIDNPVWVEADDIDLDYHVRRWRVPAPGNLAQYEKACAEISEIKLDLDRPLWQYTLIEGLANDHVGLMIKIHHAVIDGESGVQQLEVMFDPTPTPRKMEVPAPKTSAPVPGMAELLFDAFARFSLQPIEIMAKLPTIARAAEQATRQTFNQMMKNGIRLSAPPTPFNRPISKNRIYAMCSLDLNEAKALKKVANVTINDVVLAVSAGGLRRFLERRDALPEQELLSAIPVSLRRSNAGEKTDMGTLATNMTCGLATHIADAATRLQAIHQNTIEAKEIVEATKDAMMDDLNVFGLPAAVNALLRSYGAFNLADYHRPMVNVIVSNVPGPRQKVYLSGAEMLHYHPVSSVAHGLGLNITVQSYMNNLDFGLLACRNLMPDLELLRDDMEEAFEELKDAFEIDTARIVVSNDRPTETQEIRLPPNAKPRVRAGISNAA